MNARYFWFLNSLNFEQTLASHNHGKATFKTFNIIRSLNLLRYYTNPNYCSQPSRYRHRLIKPNYFKKWELSLLQFSIRMKGVKGGIFLTISDFKYSVAGWSSKWITKWRIRNGQKMASISYYKAGWIRTTMGWLIA